MENRLVIDRGEGRGERKMAEDGQKIQTYL